jgi:hypothetical protein
MHNLWRCSIRIRYRYLSNTSTCIIHVAQVIKLAWTMTCGPRHRMLAGRQLHVPCVHVLRQLNMHSLWRMRLVISITLTANYMYHTCMYGGDQLCTTCDETATSLILVRGIHVEGQLIMQTLQTMAMLNDVYAYVMTWQGGTITGTIFTCRCDNMTWETHVIGHTHTNCMNHQPSIKGPIQYTLYAYYGFTHRDTTFNLSYNYNSQKTAH